MACERCRGLELQLGGWMGPTPEAPYPCACPCAPGLTLREIQERWARHVHAMPPSLMRSKYEATIGGERLLFAPEPS